jgi:hypothetical protein
MDREPLYTEFRRKVRQQYHEAMVQIDSAIDLVIARSRAQIDRTDDPVLMSRTFSRQPLGHTSRNAVRWKGAA